VTDRRHPLWRIVERQAEHNGWNRSQTSAGSAGLVMIFERGERRLEVHFGAVSGTDEIPFLSARYRASREATLVSIAAPDAVLRVLEED
jgi:hypothetical protein